MCRYVRDLACQRIGRPTARAWPMLTASTAGTAVVASTSITFVYGYEPPRLSQRCGAQYQAYIRAVPRWRPLLPPARNTMETTGGHHANHRSSHRPC